MPTLKKTKPRDSMDETYEVNAPSSLESAIVHNLRSSISSPPPMSDSERHSSSQSQLGDPEIISSQKLNNSPEAMEIQPVQNHIVHMDDIEPKHGTSREKLEPSHQQQSIYLQDNVLEVDFTQLANEQLMLLLEQFNPIELALETIFVPFLPEYTPSIGEVDPFIRIDRPDNEKDLLGLVILAEPSLNQSNPLFINQKLETKTIKQFKKKSHFIQPQVCQDSTHLNQFIEQVEEVHKNQYQQYQYKNPINQQCLELYDKDFEAVLSQVQLPTPKLQLDIKTYFRLCCAILDVPYFEKDQIDSLMMFFELYYEAIGELENKYL